MTTQTFRCAATRPKPDCARTHTRQSGENRAFHKTAKQNNPQNGKTECSTKGQTSIFHKTANTLP
eukprot:6201880-Pleurochrysis_carterae.AAC.1